MTKLLERTECQKLLIQSTTKIYSSKGVFIGTGFFILPNILVSCYHVFYNNSIKEFKIDGQTFSIPLTPENTFFVEGLDLICIDVTFELGEQCVPLALLNSNIDDEIWGYTFNEDYDDGAALTTTIIEEAKHKGNSVFRIQDDIINQGSSGTALWNSTKNCFLGVVYWLKEHKRNALVIPSLYFQEYFPDFYKQNITYHKENPIWAAAIERDQHNSSNHQKTIKRQTHSEQFEIYNHQYIGRTTPKAALKDFLTNDKHFIFIYGIGGIGKSHLVKSVVEEHKVPFIYIRLTPSSNIKGLAYQLGLSDIEQENNSWINQDFIDSIQQINECIIIDDFYEIEDDVNLQHTLLQLATISQGKIILISRALPELYISASNTLPKIHIEYLGRTEHHQFVKEFIRFKSIGDKELIPFEEKLWEISKGHPLISQIIINYSDDDIYDDFDVDTLEVWDFEADKEGKIFIAKLLDTVLKKGNKTEREFLLNFSLILGQVPSVLLKRLPNFNRDNLKSLIRRKHFIQTLTNTKNEKTYNLHPLIRELLRKKAGDRPQIHHIAAQFFQDKAQATQYEDMVAFNNALYHFQNSESEVYEKFIKSTNPVFVGDSIKKLINSNIDASIARLKERQRRKPLDLATYNELSRLYMFRGQEEQCFSVLDVGLEFDDRNEILLFSKAYAHKYFLQEKEAEAIFEQLANLDNTYAIFQLCIIEYKAKNLLSCMRLCDWILWLEPENSQALLYKGMVLFQQRKYKDALVLFDNILRQEPENSQALLYKGMVLFQQRKYKDALVLFDEKLRQEPESIQALQYKGMVLFQQRKYKDALVLFDNILKQEPENIQALQYKGMVLFQQRKYKDALVLFDEKLRQEPESIQALQYKGMVLFQQRKYKDALVLFDNILKQEPESIQALQYKGMVLFQQRKYKDALVLFDNILRQEPENSQALQYKGMVLFQQRKYKDALVLFDNILKQEPESSQALQYKGMVLFQQRKYKDALVLFDNILRQEPENSQALQYKGMVLFQQRKYKDALVLFDNILRQEPENSQALQYKGMVLFQQRKYKDALVLFDNILKQEPESIQALQYKGMVLFQQRKYKDALVLFDNILKQEPENIQALQYKGMVLFQQKKYKDALVLFDNILKQEPENSQALLYKGKSLMKTENYVLAEQILRKANRVDNNNVFIKTEYGTALRLNDKAKDAIDMYERAIRLNTKNVQSYNGLFLTYRDNLKDYHKAIGIVDRLLKMGFYDFKLLNDGIYLLIHRNYKIHNYEKARVYLAALKKVRYQDNQTKSTIADLDYKIGLYSGS